MKKYGAAVFFLVPCLFFLIFATDREIHAAQTRPDQFHYYLRYGIEKAFNLEMANAIASLQKAVDMDRENPTGYAFLALTHLFSYEMSFDPKERNKDQAEMLRNVSETMNRGAKRIEKNPADDQAYFAMALAKIAKVRWAIAQKRYFMVTNETSDIRDYMEKVKKGDQKNVDYYFPMALLHYHIDHLPGLTRFLSSLMITSGDRKKGLQELELVAQKGHLLKELAKAELSNVYLNFEKQPARALPFVKELKDKFPNNYNFSFALANTLADLHRFKEAFVIAREIENGIHAGKPPFSPQLQPRYDQMTGSILFKQGEYAKAMEYLQKSLRDTSPYNARVRAWAFVHLGMIHDVFKERKQAEECYAKALQIAGAEGAAQIEARKYLKNPHAPPPKS
jgi:tetratricopeptide (TPR) repeat protein